MNSIFNIVNKSELLNAIFVLLFCSPFNMLFSQASYTMTAESLWRNQGYGVSNHTFDIETYITILATNYPLNPDPTTAACPNEFYTSNNLILYSSNLNSTVNTLKIRPYSINDGTDYRNGVSGIDLLAIQAHLVPTTTFEMRTPTEDFPYRYISADADYNHSVTANDVTVLQNLLLGITNSVPRPSWSWVHKDEVEINQTDFETYPDMYDYVIDYNWPGADGIILAGNSTNQINADNDKYFTFRTTKTGDIIATSGTSANSWVCGSGSYIKGNHLQNRSLSEIPMVKVRKGSIVTVEVNYEGFEELMASLFMIKIQGDAFKVKDAIFGSNFTPKWHFNSEMNQLAVLDFNYDLSALEITSGTIVKVELEALRSIDNLNEVLGWSEEREPEFIGIDESIVDVHLQLNVSTVIPPDLYSELRMVDGIQKIYIESPRLQNVNLGWYNEQGFLIQKNRINLNQGGNYLLPISNAPGIYLLQVQAENQILTTKYITW